MIKNQVMTASVSVIDMFRRWEHEADEEWSEFVDRLSAPQTPQMACGAAFHKALENTTGEGEIPTLESGGFLFEFSQFDGELPLGNLWEISTSKMYGPLLVRGRADEVSGNTVTDYKLTFGSFDAERYLDSYQWRFYLDMMGLDGFTYQVFEGYENFESGAIDVKKLHSLKLYRYPQLGDDCQKLAKRFHDVALRHPQIAKIRNESEL